MLSWHQSCARPADVDRFVYPLGNRWARERSPYKISQKFVSLSSALPALFGKQLPEILSQVTWSSTQIAAYRHPWSIFGAYFARFQVSPFGFHSLEPRVPRSFTDDVLLEMRATPACRLFNQLMQRCKPRTFSQYRCYGSCWTDVCRSLSVGSKRLDLFRAMNGTLPLLSGRALVTRKRIFNTVYVPVTSRSACDVLSNLLLITCRTL